MRIDYKVLNQVTIKDRYPIPLIKELLDELGELRYFPKLTFVRAIGRFECI